MTTEQGQLLQLGREPADGAELGRAASSFRAWLPRDLLAKKRDLMPFWGRARRIPDELA
jgi:hypothetical protein